jgi:hypothetical protein
LELLIDLALESEKRPLYPSTIEEPYFFRRYIKPWILDGINELSRAEKRKQELAS